MTRSAATSPQRTARVRTAIYTRKSSEEGLDQEFNSLQAQREACEAFINSQRHEGWVCLPQGYDDGGFSGATMDRPALQRLLADIAAGRVGNGVVYKMDRLTRSMAALGSVRLLKEELEGVGIKSKSWTSASGRLIGGNPFSRGALYLMVQNRTYLGEIVHKRQSHSGEHPPIIDQPLWDAVQAQLAS